jgi:uncharacterized protein
MAEASSDKPKSKRGFASMSPERRREIARMGGKSVPAESRAFSKQRDLAYKAGRKGGLTRRKAPLNHHDNAQRKAPPGATKRG